MKKIRRNISISEEANRVLEQQVNASEFIERRILGEVEKKVPWGNLEFRIDEVLQEVLEMKKIRLAEPKVKELKESHWTPEEDGWRKA